MSVITLYNVIIDTSVIVGVGPLLKIQRNDVQAIAYRELLFKFDLHTVNYTIVVSTDPLSFDGIAKEKSIKEYERIKEAWEQISDNMRLGYPLDAGFEDLNEDKDSEMPM